MADSSVFPRFIGFSAPANTAMSNDSVTCKAAAFFQSQSSLVSLNSFALFSSAVGAVSSAVIIVALSKTSILHINLKILLIGQAVLVFSRNVLYGYRTIEMLYRPMASLSGCPFVWEFTHCRGLTRLASRSVHAIGYSFVAIAVERIVATTFLHRYERHRKPWLGLFAEFVYTMHESVNRAFFHPIANDEGVVVYCVSISSPEDNLLNLILAIRAVPINSVSILLYAFIIYYSRQKSRRRFQIAVHSLSFRFQEKETIKATKMVIPSAVLFLTLSLSDLFLSAVASEVQATGDQLVALVLKESGSVCMAIYALLYPAIYAWANWEEIRRKISDAKKTQAELVAEQGIEIKRHFTVMTETWNAEFARQHSHGNTVIDRIRNRLHSATAPEKPLREKVYHQDIGC